MTPEQLREIEQRWGKMMGSDNPYMRNISSNLFLDVRDLLAEVRRLQCCGNCNHFDLGHDGMHIEPQCKLTTYYLEPWQKCDKWEAADNG